jgi:DNA-directed RNA polymerase subunit RPC12/RpoP
MCEEEDMKKKQIKCPCCGRRLIDSSEQINTKTRVVIGEENADYFLKCSSCKKEIGIIKITN